jgi:hypothetical protein
MNFYSNSTVVTTLAWIGGISGAVFLFQICNKLLKERSLKSLENQIKFLNSNKAHTDRIEYAMLSILMNFGLLSIIFMFAIISDTGQQERLQFIIAASIYGFTVYRLKTFKDLINHEKEIQRLETKKKNLTKN